MAEIARNDCPVQPGDVLAGKYTVERVLGVGGMGVVVAARHIHLDEHVAIKFMLPAVAAHGGELVARFMREGRAAAKIRSEHVARVTDVGTLEHGVPYLVMEYLRGRDLQEVLDAEGQLPAEDALDFVLQAGEALAEAHSLGIVHRDLKPANLFLAHRADGSPCIKVLDFGISKMSTAGESGVTRSQATMGSPLYMSPEQVMSAGNVDARADIWSLGVILYQLVAGRLPFEGESVAQVVFKVVQAPAPPLREIVPHVHPAVDAAVMRCLEKDRAARFQSVGELAVALASAAPARAEVSIERITRLLSNNSSRPPATSGRPPSQTPAFALTSPEAAPPMRRVGLVVLAVLLFLSVGVGAAALVVKQRAQARPATATSERTTSGASAASLPVASVAPAPLPSSAALAPEPPAPVTGAPSAVPHAVSPPKPRPALAPPTPPGSAPGRTFPTAHRTVVPDDRQ